MELSLSVLGDNLGKEGSERVMKFLSVGTLRFREKRPNWQSDSHDKHHARCRVARRARFAR